MKCSRQSLPHGELPLANVSGHVTHLGLEVPRGTHSLANVSIDVEADTVRGSHVPDSS